MYSYQERIPQYQYLYETLRQQILRGDFSSGDLLPSEKDLQQAFGVTQPTIRQALAMLVQDGYIRKRQGKGSIVQPIPIGLGVMSIVGRLANTTNQADYEAHIQPQQITTTILTGPLLTDFPPDILFTPSEADVLSRFYYLERLRSVNQQPVFWERLVFPNRNLVDFTSLVFENRSLFGLLSSEYNIQIKGGEQKVWATTADAAMADKLTVTEGSAVLRLDKRIDTNRTDFSFYSSLYARTDTYLLHGRF